MSNYRSNSSPINTGDLLTEKDNNEYARLDSDNMIETIQALNGSTVRTLDHNYAVISVNDVVFFSDKSHADKFIYLVGEVNLLDDVSHNLFNNRNAKRFSFAKFGDQNISDRLKLKQELLAGERHHTTGGVYEDAAEINKVISPSGRLTIHDFNFKGKDYIFFSNNHLFGYKVLPIQVGSCSTGFPYSVVPREGLESGNVFTIEDYLIVHGKNKTVIWGVDDLIDLFFDESEEQPVRVTTSVTEMLTKEYGVGSKISVDELANAIQVHPVILARVMDMDNWGYVMCAKLAKVFNTTDSYWWNLNTEYQLTWGKSRMVPADLEDIKPFSV